MLPHATPCGAAAKHAAAQGPGSPFVAVTANKDYLKTPRVCIREGIRSPGVSPSGTSTRKRLRVGDMRPLNLSGLHEADKKKVSWGFEEVVANSATADLTDSEFLQGLLDDDHSNSPPSAFGMPHIQGHIDSGIGTAGTSGHAYGPASGPAYGPASGHAYGLASGSAFGPASASASEPASTSASAPASTPASAPTSPTPPPLPPATINKICIEISKLIQTLRADRKSSALNRTETHLLSVHRRIGDIDDGELNGWQSDIVTEWFLTKGTKAKIKRNSADRRDRAGERFEQALEQINAIKELLGVQ